MFYIYENQTKPDGSVNALTVVSRSTLQLGKSYFHERCSKAYGSELFTEVGVMLADASMNVLAIERCETSYVAPEPEADAAE